ncbi:maleylpyruvate isomerase N-terminal domain-containing protein [Crossiella sp. SN42]|uniref:maleylpyruvate isomerase N-terminal domain-containing protein n=1 Tax=Crossiella sp. SN42 TaxID=2944808 RepID=UPI00207C6ACC|nr:maleylpyruvate isomerase N-terminal domain-containing protein [Crossiella sp. SN42]MCO1579717.1 maleylpyruvate isomerase N-terminal domain-containing protein [Crossiella sp. SN42]
MAGPQDTPWWLAVATEQAAAFRLAAAAADPELPVPSCPGWRFRELVLHTARFLQVVGGQLRTGGIERARPVPGPDPVGDPLAWFDRELADCLRLLAACPANRPLWTFSPAAPSLAWFWHRRVAHELNLRRWDAQAALRTLVPTDRALAVDGIDEVLGTLLASRYTAAASPAATGAVLVTCADGPERWLVWLQPGEAPEVVRDPADLPAARASTTGRATALHLGLWGRTELPGAEGDPTLLTGVQPR